MLPQEIASKKIIPPLKGLVIHRLKNLGYSQRRIAEIFEISQPQIHKYLMKTIDYYYDLLSVLGFDRRELDDYIELIIHFINKNDKPRLVIVMSSIVDRLTREYICRTREYLSDYCISSNLLIDPYIEEYKYFLARILGIKGLEKLIPEVGMNIVYAPRKPSTITDVIGLPGRIIRVGGKPVAVGEPIYGGSKHLAKVLLLAINKLQNRITTASNIRYDEALTDKLIKTHKTIVCGPHSEPSRFWTELEQCLSNARRAKVIIDHGGPGLEPVIYIFEESLGKLENLLRRIIGEF